MPGPGEGSAPQLAPPEGKAGLVMRLRAAGIGDVRTLRAFEAVPRALFLPAALRDLADAEVALPIGCGQTLSAPGTLALMIEALGVQPHHRVLDLGTGSGYAAALLARLGREVVTVERFGTLAREAEGRLRTLKVGGVRVVHADGLAADPSAGDPSAGTFGERGFDRVLVDLAAGPDHPAVLRALAPGGILAAGRRGPGGSVAVLLRLGPGDERRESVLGPARFDRPLVGVAARL